MQQQKQWPVCGPFAQVQRKYVFVSEASEGKIRKVLDVDVVAFAKQRQNIYSVIVPGSRERTRVAASDSLLPGERGLAEEAFVRVHGSASRVVHSHQANLIYEVDFFHRFT